MQFHSIPGKCGGLLASTTFQVVYDDPGYVIDRCRSPFHTLDSLSFAETALSATGDCSMPNYPVLDRWQQQQRSGKGREELVTLVRGLTSEDPIDCM